MILRRYILKCFALDKTSTPNEDDDPMVKLIDFEDVIQQGNHALNVSQHKIKASAKWFTSWTSPTLQTYYPPHNYGKSKAQYTRIKACDNEWLAPECIHWFSKQNWRRIRQGASSKWKICCVLPHHQMKRVVPNQNQTAKQDLSSYK